MATHRHYAFSVRESGDTMPFLNILDAVLKEMENKGVLHNYTHTRKKIIISKEEEEMEMLVRQIVGIAQNYSAEEAIEHIKRMLGGVE